MPRCRNSVLDDDVSMQVFDWEFHANDHLSRKIRALDRFVREKLLHRLSEKHAGIAAEKGIIFSVQYDPSWEATGWFPGILSSCAKHTNQSATSREEAHAAARRTVIEFHDEAYEYDAGSHELALKLILVHLTIHVGRTPSGGPANYHALVRYDVDTDKLFDEEVAAILAQMQSPPSL